MKKQILSLSETAILVAMAVVLNLLKILRFSQLFAIWRKHLDYDVAFDYHRYSPGCRLGNSRGITFAIVNYIIDGYSFTGGPLSLIIS